MPRIPKEQEMIFLHGIIKRLVGRFGREPQFTLSDIHSGGEGSGGRDLIAAIRDLPEAVVLEHLKDLDQRGWVKLNLSSRPWTFEIAPSFQDLPDMVTPDDIMAEKIDFVSKKLSTEYPERYQTLEMAQRRLLSAQKDEDFAEIGRLCVQFWEDFTDEVWIRYLPEQKRPPKGETKNKLGVLASSFFKSETNSTVYAALGELFEATAGLAQKTKHLSAKEEAPTSLRDAKLTLLLTSLLADEILNRLPST